MPTIQKVVCPKCKAKLKYDCDKVTSDMARFKCPGCKTVLRIKRSGPGQNEPSAGGEQAAQAPGPDIREAGQELLELAQKFEEEMGFGEPRREDIAEEEETSADSPETADSIAENTEEVSAEEESSRTDSGEEGLLETTKEVEGGTAKVSNARKFKRVKFKKKVLVNNQIMVEALDICENGLFLHTGRSFEDGAIVEVGIPTQRGRFDLTVQAMVRHNHRGIGMGLEFVDLDENQKERLHKLISELDEAAAQELEGRKKILLVGGTDTARNINKSKLVLDGFYVLQATTADEVFQILRDESPDAMVLEWQETVFNCKGLLARINEMPEYDAVIRIVLSVLTDTYVQREILDAGAHRYMAKMDTNPARLSLALKQLIEERDG